MNEWMNESDFWLLMCFWLMLLRLDDGEFRVGTTTMTIDWWLEHEMKGGERAWLTLEQPRQLFLLVRVMSRVGMRSFKICRRWERRKNWEGIQRSNREYITRSHKYLPTFASCCKRAVVHVSPPRIRWKAIPRRMTYRQILISSSWAFCLCFRSCLSLDFLLSDSLGSSYWKGIIIYWIIYKDR